MLHSTLTGNTNGKPVLYLHGFLGAASDWNRVSAQLLQHDVLCIAVDLPGHGRSVGYDTAMYTFDGCAQAIIDALDDIGVQQCGMVGYSMGGRIALYLAAQHPDRFNTIVLESASPGLPTGEERQARREHDERLAQQLESGDFGAFLERWYAQPLFQTLAADEARLQRMIAQRRQNDPRELEQALRGLSTGAQPSLWERLPSLTVPLLVVAGEHDAKFRALGERMAELQPKTHRVVVSDAGHNVHEEQPDAFVQVVRAFLAEDTTQD